MKHLLPKGVHDMTRNRFLGAITLFFSALSIVCLPVSAAPPGTLPFGVYDPDGQFSNDPEVTIEHVFLPWEDVNLSSLLDADVYALERTRALVITIEPWTWTRDERNTADFLWNGIRQGYYDANMKAVCEVIGSLQSPVSVRWGHEMETDDGQFIWSAWEPKNYIASFRRITDICREEAPNAQIIWSPIGLENASEYYPGDDYVDLVGLSIFGFEAWEKAILGGPQNYADVLTARYNEVKEFNKPVFVAEVGFTGTRAYVDAWEAKVREPRPDLPLLVGAVYFNQREVYPWPNDFGYPDWRVDQRVTE
jgi:endoglucanase